jgi:hypothetical protein
MVIPVPVVLDASQVRTLPHDVFERIDTLSAPRLVEYWEREPQCPSPFAARMARIPRIRSGTAEVQGMVNVEALFAVGEYDVAILGAEDSVGLEQWLHQQGYRIPVGAAEALRPYVASGSKFLVARVDVSRLELVNGRARLSPLRIHYDDPDFRLPIRLGLIHSGGEQDLLMVVLSRSGRYEAANVPNALIPTNLVVPASALEDFSGYYRELFDRTSRGARKAVVTEYAWEASTCDPCPGPALTDTDVTMLGGDVLPPGPDDASSWGPGVLRVGEVTAIAGRSGSADEIRRILEARGTQLSACVPTYGITEVSLSFDVRSDGRMQLSPAMAETARGHCLARALRRVRLVDPPLRRGPSQWRVMLRFVATQVRLAGAPGFTLTRLRYRYPRHAAPDDIVLRLARPIEGGTGQPNAHGVLPRGARPAAVNRFQARYAVLHEHSAELECAHPRHDGWNSFPPAHALGHPPRSTMGPCVPLSQCWSPWQRTAAAPVFAPRPSPRRARRSSPSSPS